LLVHRIPIVDAELLNAVVMVLALVVIAGLAVLFVARYVSLRRSVSIEDLGPLSEAEKRGLKAWARRTKVAFAGAMLFVLLNGVLLIVTNPAPLWLGWLSLVAAVIIVVVGLVIHLSGRCPRCGYMIGFQSPLLLPYRCERCKTPFR
jgi:NADH:ubiquinone oxidoreductase subunit 3 (subunit A)